MDASAYVLPVYSNDGRRSLNVVDGVVMSREAPVVVDGQLVGVPGSVDEVLRRPRGGNDQSALVDVQ